jgi:hypothetical protein
MMNEKFEIDIEMTKEIYTCSYVGGISDRGAKVLT